MTLLLDYYGTVKLINVLAANSGYSLEFEETGGKGNYDSDNPMRHIGSPRTNGKTLTVSAPDPSWSREQLNIWAGVIHHEINHLSPLGQDAFQLMRDNEVACDSFYGMLFNCLEDHRVDKGNTGTYAGKDMLLSEADYVQRTHIINKSIGDNHVENRRKAIEANLPEDERADALMRADILDAMFALDTLGRGEWQKNHRGLYDDLTGKLSERSQKWCKQLEGRLSELQGLSDAQSTLDLEESLLEDVFHYDLEQLKKESSEMCPKEGEGEGRAGAGKGGGKGKGKGKGASGDGDGEGGERVNEFINVTFKDRMPNNHLSDPEEGKGQHVIYEDKDLRHTDGFIPSPNMEVVIGKDLSIGSSETRWAVSAEKKFGSAGSNLAGIVRKLMQVKSQSIFRGGKKRGRLSSRDLHRITTLNTNLFKVKEDAMSTDVAVTVLTDMSGSMGGESTSKYGCAAIATAQLNDAITVNGIDLEVIGFTETRHRKFKGAYPVHTIFRTFKERIDGKKLVEMFAARRNHCMMNSDGESIMYAHDRLIRTDNKRKILIVLSDGSPYADNKTGNVAAFTKQVIKEIEDRSPVEIYGIGIMDDNVRRLYAEHDVISNAAELEAALLKVISSKIIR